MSESGQAPSADLARLLRWENAGATWQLLTVHEGVATVSMCRCDGGEEMERLRSAAPDLVAYVSAGARSA